MHALLVRITAAFLFLIAIALPLRAQGDEDDYDFSEIPVEEEEIPYIGVGGGYQLLVTLFDRAALNDVAADFSIDEFTGPMYMHGGGGWTAIGIIPNVRVGVFGGGGSKEQTMDTSFADGAYKRSMQFSAGYTAAHIDYAIPLFNKVTVAPGVMIGGGSTTLELTQTKSDVTFGQLFDPNVFRGASSFNHSASMTRTYLFLYPVVSVEVALTQFILLRAGGGYALTRITGEDWDDRHGTTIAEVPEIDVDGLTFHVGLFLGLFQQ